MKNVISIACVALLLTACKPLIDQSPNTMEPEKPVVEQEQAKEPEEKNTAVVSNYKPYQAGVLADGQTKILFFHAAWCPVCIEADKELSDWYATEQIPLPMYRVDYDTEKELKKQYGVTVQHTFVVVDGSGKMMSAVTGPSAANLKRLIYGNTQPAK